MKETSVTSGDLIGFESEKGSSMRVLRIVAFLTFAAAAVAQMRDNQEKQLTCAGRTYDDHARHCDIREQLAAGTGLLNVDAGRNGGATVKGWLRSDVLVRAKVESWGDTDSEAQSTASQVLIDTSGGHVQAHGPETGNGNSGWSVSYEIFVPQSTNLTVQTVNGGIAVTDIRGSLRLDTKNGGINLRRLAGEITGSTVNGGVNIVLDGTIWDGSQIQVTTKNGGVTIAVPENYSAHFQTETTNGSLQTDFPITLTGELQNGRRPRNHDFSVGAGGPLIHITTQNGSVRLKRS
jgi:DUF4097 and DUF4098 domain-containing protein YvlB